MTERLDRQCVGRADFTGGEKLLGHRSIPTTGDIYADWDIDHLTETMADVIAADQIVPSEPYESPANHYFMVSVQSLCGGLVRRVLVGGRRGRSRRGVRRGRRRASGVGAGR